MVGEKIEGKLIGEGKKHRKILLVYPDHPKATYWSFSYVLPMLGKKASMPPLGLITVAAMLPPSYQVRLVDMNVEPLLDEQIEWADAIMTSTMIVQDSSLKRVIEQANRFDVPVIAGGPHPTATPESIEGAAHIIVGEAETVFPEFLADWEAGHARRIYKAGETPSITDSPLPRFDLLDLSAYASMAVQYSRGCPFHCEFCDIWKLYGNRPRVKGNEQVLEELNALHELGWNGNLFFVDDNFIGNKKTVKELMLPLHSWQEDNQHPFSFYTEASMNLARDKTLLSRMREAGFGMVFLGIETPSEAALKATNKLQNMRQDLLTSVQIIQEHGIEVSAGFIVGFDTDEDDIFERQIRFIERAGIPMAMVGLLSALPGTELYKRLESEGRLTGECGGNNTHIIETNFVTRMDKNRLAQGYQQIINTVYDQTLMNYFNRCRTLLDRLSNRPYRSRRVNPKNIKALLISLLHIPFRSYGREYFKFLVWTLAHHRKWFPEAVRLGIEGFHFRQITRGALGMARLGDVFQRKTLAFQHWAAELARSKFVKEPGFHPIRFLSQKRRKALKEIHRLVRFSPKHCRPDAEKGYRGFLAKMDGFLSEHVPENFAEAARGAVNMARFNEFLKNQEGHFHEKMVQFRRAVWEGKENIDQKLKNLNALRRKRVREARRLARALPHEYRMLGKSEYRQFVKRMNQLKLELRLLLAASPNPA